MTLLLALLPALVMITMVIITRKVLISLGVGIILAALIHEGFNPIDASYYIWQSFFGIVTDIHWYLPILAFVVLIGSITAVISLSGGVKAFASWAVSKVKTPVAAQLLTWVLGIIIMIDDYFNALVIGEVSKPITDQYGISRAKLSYLIDSTSAPVVILMPFSTWGAYIIGLIGALFIESGYTVQSGFSGFVSAIPYQFYPITTLIMVFLVVRFGLEFGPMKRFDNGAILGNDTSKVEAEEEQVEIEGRRATHWHLILPILLLVVMTFVMMLVKANFNVSAIMEQEITIPLLVGGISAFLLALIMALLDRSIHPKSILTDALKGSWAMAKSAVVILILAWMVSNAIQDLGTGDLIAEVVVDANLTPSLLPLILFVIAGAMAFSTGTSWGSFGILLPIAIPIAMSTDITFMPAIIAAVLGGAVFGDHASPVSDTTVLSATGARSKLHAHFISQLPYALISASIAAIGYLIYGLSHMVILSYIFIVIALFAFVYSKRYWRRNIN